MAGTKLFMFETCEQGNFNYDWEKGKYDPDEPVCYDGRVRALREFPVVQLCGRGSPVSLKGNIDYCASCEFHSERG